MTTIEALKVAEMQNDLIGEIARLRAALKPFAEIARRLKWADLEPDDPLRDEHVMEAPAEDIAPGAAFCLFVGAFQDAARAVGEEL